MGKQRVSRGSAIKTGEALGYRDPGFGCQWGKPCSALAFHPFSWLKDSEHSRHSRHGPHQPAVVYLGVLCFFHQHDQQTGGSRVALAGGFTSVPSRCQRLLPRQVPTPLLQRGEHYFLSLLWKNSNQFILQGQVTPCPVRQHRYFWNLVSISNFPPTFVHISSFNVNLGCTGHLSYISIASETLATWSHLGPKIIWWVKHSLLFRLYWCGTRDSERLGNLPKVTVLGCRSHESHSDVCLWNLCLPFQPELAESPILSEKVDDNVYGRWENLKLLEFSYICCGGLLWWFYATGSSLVLRTNSQRILSLKKKKIGTGERKMTETGMTDANILVSPSAWITHCVLQRKDLSLLSCGWRSLKTWSASQQAPQLSESSRSK